MSEPETGSLLIKHGVGTSHPLRVVRVTLDGEEVGKISSFNAPSSLENGTFPLSAGEHAIEIGVGPFGFASKKVSFVATAGKRTIFRVVCREEALIIFGGLPGAAIGLLIRSSLPDLPLSPLIISASAIVSLVVAVVVCFRTPGLIVQLKNETK